ERKVCECLTNPPLSFLGGAKGFLSPSAQLPLYPSLLLCPFIIRAGARPCTRCTASETAPGPGYALEGRNWSGAGNGPGRVSGAARERDGDVRRGRSGGTDLMPDVMTPWTVAVRDRTLVVTFPAPYRVLSWAPLGEGLLEARTIFNRQVRTEEDPAQEPALFLRA